MSDEAIYAVLVGGRFDNGGSFTNSRYDYPLDRPFPTMTLSGGSAGCHHQALYYLTRTPPPEPPMTDATKPPYRVPSMGEIFSSPLNGFKVVSTFSGGGGSSLGYRMAGFKVLWASEFIPAAQDTYRLNFPETHLDTSDIRIVRVSQILKATGLREGELDLFDGSPPCASFSTAGAREKGWGQVKQYSDTYQRTDDLFFQYARLLDGLRPKAFVAENVTGIIKGKARGYFLEIIREFKKLGYRTKAATLDASWLGVPQARQRVFFVGVREDLGLDPVFPTPLPYQYTVRDALPHIMRIRLGGAPGDVNWRDAGSRPAGTVVQSDGKRKEGDEGGYLSSYLVEAETDISKYAIGAEWEKLRPGETSSKYFQLMKADPDKPLPTVMANGAKEGAASSTHPYERRKWAIWELKRICGFPDDFQLTGDYKRQWERLGRSVPPVMMSHVAAAVRDGVLAKIAGGG